MRIRFTLLATLLSLAVAGTSFAGSLVVDGNHKVIRRGCAGLSSVVIGGNHNVVTLTGNCANVQIDGNHNVVNVEGVSRLLVQGNHNTVSWKRGVGGRPASVSNLGKHNKVRQVP